MTTIYSNPSNTFCSTTPQKVQYDSRNTMTASDEWTKMDYTIFPIGCDISNGPAQWIRSGYMHSLKYFGGSFFFLMRTSLSSGQKWSLSPYFAPIGNIIVLKSGLGFTFRKCPSRKWGKGHLDLWYIKEVDPWLSNTSNMKLVPGTCMMCSL